MGGARRVAPAGFDAQNQSYGVNGSGANMWGTRDEFHFVWRRMRGDFIVTTRALFVGRGKAGNSGHASVGVYRVGESRPTLAPSRTSAEELFSFPIS